MKLYKLTQDVNDDWDTYDSCVVCAVDEEDAKTISPDGYETPIKQPEYTSWCTIKDVKVEYIGEAVEGLKRGVIVASFNAG